MLAQKVPHVQDGYKLWAVLLPPIPPLIVAGIVFFNRRSKERGGLESAAAVSVIHRISLSKSKCFVERRRSFSVRTTIIMQDQENKRTDRLSARGRNGPARGVGALVSRADGRCRAGQRGQKLFPDFSDPLSAASLEVFRYDEDTSTIRPFKVAKVNGVWSIPSHSNYPADAREHMAEAATALLDIKILNVASTSPGDQELYGVVAPDPKKLRQGAPAWARRSRSKTARTRCWPT